MKRIATDVGGTFTDIVVFDEAHRLTPTAETFHQAGRLLASNTPRVLLMTATPHRGKEWLFRALLHLVDPDVYPPVAANEETTHAVKPGRVHFLRRMKEDLVDFDGVTKLFKGRRAANETVPLNPTEQLTVTLVMLADVMGPAPLATVQVWPVGLVATVAL